MQLDGKEISVRGWIGGCQPSDNRVCGLHSSRRKAIGPKPKDWPLPVRFDGQFETHVREVVAHGVYKVTCRTDQSTICLEYDGHFSVKSIEDL